MTNDQQPPAEPAATVEVALGERSYTIHIGERAIERAGALVRPLLTRPFCVIVSDANVAERHLASLQAALAASGIKSAAAIVAPGETSKSYAGLSDLCEELLAAGVERSDLVLAFGGGVVGDLAGFAAARSFAAACLCAGPDHVLAQVEFGGRRQDRHQFGAGQEPGRRLSPAPRGDRRYWRCSRRCRRASSRQAMPKW